MLSGKYQPFYLALVCNLLTLRMLRPEYTDNRISADALALCGQVIISNSIDYR